MYINFKRNVYIFVRLVSLFEVNEFVCVCMSVANVVSNVFFFNFLSRFVRRCVSVSCVLLFVREYFSNAIYIQKH